MHAPDGLHDGAYLVVAVRAPRPSVQRQVDLGVGAFDEQLPLLDDFDYVMRLEAYAPIAMAAAATLGGAGGGNGVVGASTSASILRNTDNDADAAASSSSSTTTTAVRQPLRARILAAAGASFVSVVVVNPFDVVKVSEKKRRLCFFFFRFPSTFFSFAVALPLTTSLPPLSVGKKKKTDPHASSLGVPIPCLCNCSSRSRSNSNRSSSSSSFCFRLCLFCSLLLFSLCLVRAPLGARPRGVARPLARRRLRPPDVAAHGRGLHAALRRRAGRAEGAARQGEDGSGREQQQQQQ